jgi:TRAP-type C4-dicarboxylate transport system permease large subunit
VVGTLSWETFSGSLLFGDAPHRLIMLILAGAAFTTAAMAFTGIPAALATWVQEQQLSPYT